MCRYALLVAGVLLVPVSLHAQSEEALLQRRLARLTARQAQLAAAAAARDTAAWTRERFQPVGKPPLVFLMPGWVEPAAAPLVRAVVDSWTVRTGTVFTEAPPETLRLAVRSDTLGWSHAQVEAQLRAFPLEVVERARLGTQARVGRRLGDRLITWAGSPLFLTSGERARRGAILALARDTTGVGARCLEGEVHDCLTILGRDRWENGAVRRSLLAFTLDRAGVAGWQLLARDTLGAPEHRIGEVAGRGYEAAVEVWLQDLRSSRWRRAGDLRLLPLALAWSVALVALFLWRLRWHHA